MSLALRDKRLPHNVDLLYLNLLDDSRNQSNTMYIYTYNITMVVID